MNLKKLIPFAAIALFAVTACKKHGAVPKIPPVDKDPFFVGPNIYVVGTTTTGVNAYWTNKVITKLPGSTGSIADGIDVVGMDVYVSGYTIGTNGNFIATYWKNGVAVKLTNGPTSAEARHIAVIDTDVYVIGFSENVSPAAYCWKNGVAQKLTTGASSGMAFSISVYNNDIYIAGISDKHAAYWKNGKLVTLTAGLSTSYLSNIIVNSDGIYAAGSTKEGPNSQFTATFWKNGIPSILSDSSRTVFVSGMTIYKKDVYVSGFTGSGYNSTVSWKNGELFMPSRYTSGSGIAVYENDLYTSGDFPGYLLYGKLVTLPGCATTSGIVRAY